MNQKYQEKVENQLECKNWTKIEDYCYKSTHKRIEVFDVYHFIFNP